MNAPVRQLETLAREIDGVASYLRSLRVAINALRVPELVDTRLRAAQQDLLDVVSATQDAANKILDTAEMILSAKETGDDYRALVEDRMMALLEICSFQDLAGQRVTRVSKTISALDERLSGFAREVRASNGKVGPETREAARLGFEEANLLHGPQTISDARQAEIDQLMAG
jgi:chemotaxis protein CheZ